jgi:hypothetical protein
MISCWSMSKVKHVIFSRVLILLNLSCGGSLGTYHYNGIVTLRCCIFTATKMIIESQLSCNERQRRGLCVRVSTGVSVYVCLSGSQCTCAYVCLPIRCGPTLNPPRIPNGSHDNLEPLYCGSAACHVTSWPGYPHEHAHCPSLLDELNVAVSAGEPATAPVYVAKLSMELGQFLT